ncbi:MAG: Dabb family protein [Actinomycetes bacterium]
MIWHIVRFDFDGVDDAVRADLEAALAGLDTIDVVAVCHVARDLEQPSVTGLVTAFATHADLEAYRVHPEHVPVVDGLRAAGVVTTRIDIELPSTLGPAA